MSANADKKNMKEEVKRQVVVAQMCLPDSYFKVPKGKDINKAHKWWVESNTLHIYWTKKDEDNKNVEEIDSYYDNGAINAADYPVKETWVNLAEDLDDDEE